MTQKYLKYIGGIFFFIGLILITVSWHLTYPVYMPESDKLIFSQFFPSIWPGTILSLLGLFLTGYFSKNKAIKVICVSIFPIIFYSIVYFFSYTPTSDSGAVKGMFEVFHYTGINTSIESYFYYPIYFSQNEMTSQILGFNVNILAAILFMIFGVLISLYIYLFIFKNTKNDIHQTAFLAIPLYFIASFPFLNYQWVPQTLALIFFLMLLLLLFEQKKSEYKLLSIIIFTVLVFTHLFIPVIFLIFLGIYAIKDKKIRLIFLLMSCIYSTVLIYYTTFYLESIIHVFKESIYGFAQEYSNTVSRAFLEPKDLMSNIISLVNRMIIPFTWILMSLGFMILFLKRKINYSATVLGITSVLYLGVGFFYSVLGTRALQILCIPLLLGIGFFIYKWKKLTLIIITLIIILSIFSPIRTIYEGNQFQVKEEENTCNFLAYTITINQTTRVAIGGVNYGYFSKKVIYFNMNEYGDFYLPCIVPSDPKFNDFFNTKLEKNEFIMYNSNLEKEVNLYWMNEKNASLFKENLLFNNIVYKCGKTLIITGS